MADEPTRLVVGDTTYIADDWAALSRVVVSSELGYKDTITLPVGCI